MFSRFLYLYSQVNRASFYKSSGFSFIEVLVAAAIFSSAILPLVSLSISNLQASTQLQQQASVTSALHSFSLRLSLNQQYIVDGGESTAYFQQDLYKLSRLGNCETSLFQCFCLTQSSSSVNCRNSLCTSAQLAVYDIHEFSCQLAKLGDSFQIQIEERDARIQLSVFRVIGGSSYEIASLDLRFSYEKSSRC